MAGVWTNQGRIRIEPIDDFREEGNWYYDSVEDVIPEGMEEGEFDSAEELGWAVEIHAKRVVPDQIYSVDWEKVGEEILERDYDAEITADIGKRISGYIVSEHGEHLRDIRFDEAGRLDRVLDSLYSVLNQERQEDYHLKEFEEQNEEAWSRVETVNTEEVIEFVEEYKAGPRVIGIG